MLAVALLVVMITEGLWLVLAVTVAMVVALIALQEHDRRRAAALARREIERPGAHEDSRDEQ